MDDRSLFGTLILAHRLGIVSKEQVIAIADQRILEIDQPEYWMIEVSIDGDSEALRQIDYGDESVYKEVLRMAFQAWIDGSISDQTFRASCETLWSQIWREFELSSGWDKLLWITVEFDLVEQGINGRKDSIKRIKEVVEEYLNTEEG
jgi:hypothetical protein